mmetsp:Transcript_53728/g.136321  ORF Transcript_53728/g.136321 Transcript_53728/m.136321 type:complete len:487 (-) Transcript_53728:68-1528(-)
MGRTSLQMRLVGAHGSRSLRAVARGAGGGGAGGQVRSKSAATSSVLSTSSVVHRQHWGFKHREYGLQWYPSRDALLEADPGPVLVGTSYEYAKGERVTQARKYSAFQSHEDYFEVINDRLNDGLLHNLHEVMQETEARCLYFDLDGPPSYRAIHNTIISLLRQYVWWFFGGERRAWRPEALEPVVLTSEDPNKYSAHVVFPEVQFRDHAHQEEYIKVLLSALPALTVDMPDGSKLPLLEKIVDCMPYSRFQLFRGPYACKLKQGQLMADTCLEPEGYFRSDPLAAFASHVDPGYALPLPSVEQLLAENEELRHFRNSRSRLISLSARRGQNGMVSSQDEANLFQPLFQMPGDGELDLVGMTDVEQFETALKWLHPHRATQFWSWFRLSGVTYSMLARYTDNPGARRRILDAHFAWSRGYESFDKEENVNMIEKSQGRPVSGLSLLMRLARFDNPDMTVRETVMRIAFSGLERPWKTSAAVAVRAEA